MFTSKPRRLSFPLDRAVEMTVLTPPGEEVCGMPEFPLDSDERITVLFNLSLNEFVALASAIDAGIDLAFAEDAQKVWFIWVRSVMCASFCQQMADCLTSEDPAVVAALANLIATNPDIWAALSSAMSELGFGVPGQALTPDQASADTLPENVKNEFGDCELDELYGAMLFVVQRGDRAIVDFLEIIEEQSNALEASAIVSGAIPAAGPYAEAGFQFADQLLENISEGYAAAYTEEYEIALACELFCAARLNCTLTPDMLVGIMAARLAFPDPSEFGDVMTGIGGAIYPGTNFADSAFYIYFTALKFGQKFGDTIGFRPLTDQMALGAEQLASAAWEIECDCAATEVVNIGLFDVCGDTVEFIAFEDGVPFDVEAYAFVVIGVTNYIIALQLPLGNWNITLNSFTGTVTPPSDTAETAYAWHDTSSGFHNVTWNTPADPSEFGSHDTTRAIFAPWCVSVPWNAALFNGTPFSANFTVTAI